MAKWLGGSVMGHRAFSHCNHLVVNKLTLENIMSKQYVPNANSPIVSIAAWNKTDRRSGINPRTQQEFNDPHLNCKIQLNTIKLATILAAALAKGEMSVEVLGGLWCNATESESDPAITGNADVTRADIEARKLAAAQAASKQMLAALETMNLEQPKQAVSA